MGSLSSGIWPGRLIIGFFFIYVVATGGLGTWFGSCRVETYEHVMPVTSSLPLSGIIMIGLLAVDFACVFVRADKLCVCVCASAGSLADILM